MWRVISKKGEEMDTEEQVAAAVEAGVAIFADLEARAQECVTIAEGFVEVFETIRDGGHISNFECRALKMEAKAIVRGFQAQLHAFHAKTTQRAQLKGIDVPSTEGGGDR